MSNDPHCSTETESEPSNDNVVSPIAIAKSLESYASVMDSFFVAVPSAMFFLTETRKATRAEFEELRDGHGRILEETDGEQKIEFPLEIGPKAFTLVRRIREFDHSVKIVPQMFLTSLVSQYDAFLSQIISFVLYEKPEILDSSERKLSFSELMSFGSLAEAREYLIEKEVESVLRESHTKHFEYLEKKLSIPLRRDLEQWPRFIELTERRNLFTHTGGIVSRQYLSVCRTHGVSLPADIKAGSKLAMQGKYFEDAHRCLYEIGAKLAHVVWRKLRPDDLAAADSSAMGLCYNLLKRQEFNLASALLTFFAKTIKKHSSERVRRVLIINLAQAEKFAKREKNMKEILESEDWSICTDDFTICLAVLRDKFDEAATVMRKMGEAGAVSKHCYIDWPVFREFRKSQHFTQAYKDVFKEEFVLVGAAAKRVAEEVKGSDNDLSVAASPT